MGEIKFRAWGATEYSGWKPEMQWSFDIETDGEIFYKSEAQTDWILMQFTGLKDKNGKEIYEGDILCMADELKDPILDDGSGPVEPFNHLSPVCFDTIGGFGVDVQERGDILKKRFYSFLDIVNETGQAKFEIVGNIYENQELLK